MDHHLRRSALAERLAGLEVDALLVTGLTNVRYLTGFTGSNAQLLVARDAGSADGAGVFFTDGRYTEQSRHEVPDMERVTYAGAFAEALGAQVSNLGIERLGFEAEHVTVRAHGRLSAGLGDGVELVACDDEVEHLRWIKVDDELELLNSAQAVTDQAF
ncbi:MAG TPA: aminopeptidase P family N-terminal domain-containing protein, partial [Actinomycetota bacterium]|nr:aminopeptidase P family N-terminal domain-containing protein [Actinomycetota bacterium]